MSSFKSLLILVFMFAVLLFMGCSSDGGNGFQNVHFIPVGEWNDGFGGAYNISSTTLEYYMAESVWEGVTYPGSLLKGDILVANDFSSNSGVLLLRITELNNIELTVGKYTCVYYRDYTSSHVLLANPIDEAWDPIETDTLAQAESLFTVHNVGTHVSMWGSGYGR